MKKYNVGLVGVGAVGSEMIKVLKERKFPLNGEVKVFASRERDEKILGDIAAAGGGAYLHATDRDFGLESVVKALKELKTTAYDALVFDDYEEHYIYFYWAALALLVLGLLPGERRPKRRLFR